MEKWIVTKPMFPNGRGTRLAVFWCHNGTICSVSIDPEDPAQDAALSEACWDVCDMLSAAVEAVPLDGSLASWLIMFLNEIETQHGAEVRAAYARMEMKEVA
jgi:hypothetical protein